MDAVGVAQSSDSLVKVDSAQNFGLLGGLQFVVSIVLNSWLSPWIATTCVGFVLGGIVTSFFLPPGCFVSLPVSLAWGVVGVVLFLSLLISLGPVAYSAYYALASKKAFNTSKDVTFLMILVSMVAFVLSTFLAKPITSIFFPNISCVSSAAFGSIALLALLIYLLVIPMEVDDSSEKRCILSRMLLNR